MAYNKYYVYKEQVSRDNGLTWSYTGNETPSGDSIGTYDTLAECEEPQYRTISGTPYCTGYDKYVDVYSQVSYDAGVTWETTATTPTLIEANSEDCGYVPPTPTGTKFSATYSGGQTYSMECNSSTELTSSETQPSGYEASAMTSAAIGNCVKIIGYGAFAYHTSLTGVTIPNSVTSIDKFAFNGCSSLTGIAIPSGVTSINYETFRNCSSLTDIILPDNLINIGEGAFHSCSNLSSIGIPSGVTSIGKNAFNGCSSLTNINIPFGLQTLTDYVFTNCTSLTAITIPSTVKTISTWAFNGCKSLTSITVKSTVPPSLGSEAFNNTNNCPIYVPSGSVSTYKSAAYWYYYASRIQPIP